MGWVSLRLWSFSPGKVVRPGCLLWSNPAPPLMHSLLRWSTPVILDLFRIKLLVDFLFRKNSKNNLNRLTLSTLCYVVLWMLRLLATAGVCEGLRGGREARVGRLGRVVGLDLVGRG